MIQTLKFAQYQMEFTVRFVDLYLQISDKVFRNSRMFLYRIINTHVLYQIGRNRNAKANLPTISIKLKQFVLILQCCPMVL